MQYLPPLITRVEDKVSKILSDIFILIFGGYAARFKHYVADFPLFPAHCDNGHKVRLLTFLRLRTRVIFLPVNI